MLKLYNTLGAKVEPFKLREGKKAYVYICGVTPYDSCHIGHARTYVAFDILRRWMEYSEIEVVHIQNVTDIDDKIIKRAQERKMMPLELSKKFDEESRKDFEAMGLLKPTHMPKISEHIPQTLKMIEKIIENGHAYTTKSGVYFDISSFPEYGNLSGQDLEKVRAGARVEINEDKRNPEDFALWKLEETPGATYDSPWGKGRPGWHIECSAMSMHYSGGKPLEMHAGGKDLVFPHHENEVAQTEASGIKPFARHWVHFGFLTVNGEKMAKSLGNFITIKDALKKWDAQTLRLFYALAHYRSPIDFSESAINSAKNTLENVKRSLSLMEGEGAKKGEKGAEGELEKIIEERMSNFSSHMNNDLNTPEAISELIEASKEIARARAENKCSRKVLEHNAEKIIKTFEILGICIVMKNYTFTDMGLGSDSVTYTVTISKEAVEKLIAEREVARKSKNFAKADDIRKKLASAGVILEDSKDGARWRYS